MFVIDIWQMLLRVLSGEELPGVNSDNEDENDDGHHYDEIMDD